MAFKTGYDINSPDGFGMFMDRIYSSPEKAENAFQVWIKRYENQGYYSNAKREKIPLDQLRNHCKLVKFEFDLNEFIKNEGEFI
jgi:hypothetical protein